MTRSQKIEENGMNILRKITSKGMEVQTKRKKRRQETEKTLGIRTG
jgi:hypothetical protein